MFRALYFAVIMFFDRSRGVAAVIADRPRVALLIPDRPR
jgi:hypothetical protein